MNNPCRFRIDVIKPMGINSGFTLLELLISLTIFSIIVLVVFSAFRTGVRAWEKGEENIASNQEIRVVYTLLRQQLAEIWYQEDDKLASRYYVLKGDSQSLQFNTAASLNPAMTPGWVHMSYLVTASGDTGKMKLLVNEISTEAFMKWATSSKFQWDGNDNINEYSVLIDAMDSISFSYLSDSAGTESSEPLEAENGFSWKETWDPALDKGFPKAIRIRLRKDSDMTPVDLIVRAKTGAVL